MAIIDIKSIPFFKKRAPQYKMPAHKVDYKVLSIETEKQLTTYFTSLLGQNLSSSEINDKAYMAYQIFCYNQEQNKDMLMYVDIDTITAKNLKDLIDKGADVNVMGVSGSLFMYLCQMSDAEMDVYDEIGALTAKKALALLKILIQNGVDVNQKDKTETPALVYVAEANSLDFVKLLLENGADINAVDDYNQTPLIHAVSSRAYEVVDYLLKNGANVSIKDGNNMTAEKYAKAKYDKKLMALFNKTYPPRAKMPADDRPKMVCKRNINVKNKALRDAILSGYQNNKKRD